MTDRGQSRRGGAATVEAAVVLPVLFLVVFGLIAGGVGVFRYQQVAYLARESARWASVRGGNYQRDTNLDSPTRQQIVDNAVTPYAVGMDPAALDVQVQLVNQGTGTTTDWDASAKDVRSLTPAGDYVNNSVRVTVSYEWVPGFFWGPQTLQSVCVMPMSN
jgi:Flp pilus assembly protein TadG